MRRAKGGSQRFVVAGQRPKSRGRARLLSPPAPGQRCEAAFGLSVLHHFQLDAVLPCSLDCGLRPANSRSGPRDQIRRNAAGAAASRRLQGIQRIRCRRGGSAGLIACRSDFMSIPMRNSRWLTFGFWSGLSRRLSTAISRRTTTYRVQHLDVKMKIPA